MVQFQAYYNVTTPKTFIMPRNWLQFSRFQHDVQWLFKPLSEQNSWCKAKSRKSKLVYFLVDIVFILSFIFRINKQNIKYKENLHWHNLNEIGSLSELRDYRKTEMDLEYENLRYIFCGFRLLNAFRLLF